MAGEEREILFETFRVWLDNDGSLCATGELQICRPNTVRYRLHKIEQRTGARFRARETSPNCRWLERYTAASHVAGAEVPGLPEPSAPTTRRCNSYVRRWISRVSSVLVFSSNSDSWKS